MNLIKVLNVNFVCWREGKFVTKWFVGLVFVPAPNQNIDLTYDIQNFMDIGKHAFQYIVPVKSLIVVIVRIVAVSQL